MNRIKKEIRALVARLYEFYPKAVIITGAFSALEYGNIQYEFLAAGEEKLRRRMSHDQHEFYKALFPGIAKEFEDHHQKKLAFIIEWLVVRDTQDRPSVSDVADLIYKHIEAEAQLHDKAPDDLLDIDYTVHRIEWQLSLGERGHAN